MAKSRITDEKRFNLDLIVSTTIIIIYERGNNFWVDLLQENSKRYVLKQLTKKLTRMRDELTENEYIFQRFY